jgi:hypothetical protein
VAGGDGGEEEQPWQGRVCRCWGGRGEGRGGRGCAAVLVGCRWQGGKTEVAGVPLHCWGGGDVVGA